MVNKFAIIGFFIYLLMGLYFINYPLNFIKIPEFVSGFEAWIIFVGGILILVGGINYLRTSKKRY